MGICKPSHLLDNIKCYRSIHALEQRVIREREYLQKSYGSISSLKSAFTFYRNFLKANLSPDYILQGKSVIDTTLNHLRLTELQQAQFMADNKREVRKGKSNLRLIYDIDKYINKAKDLLSAVSYYDNILAISALTGRRVAEVACSATFIPTGDDQNTKLVIFDGQLKTKTRDDCNPYEIPLLCEYSHIKHVLNGLRRAKPNFIGNPPLFHNICSKELSMRVKRHFTGLFEGEPKVKDLRAIYALLCFTEFHKIPANRKIDRDVYFSRILGHSINDTTTCGSYVDFYVI